MQTIDLKPFTENLKLRLNWKTLPMRVFVFVKDILIQQLIEWILGITESIFLLKVKNLHFSTTEQINNKIIVIFIKHFTLSGSWY